MATLLIYMKLNSAQLQFGAKIPGITLLVAANVSGDFCCQFSLKMNDCWLHMLFMTFLVQKHSNNEYEDVFRQPSNKSKSCRSSGSLGNTSEKSSWLSSRSFGMSAISLVMSSGSSSVLRSGVEGLLPQQR